METSRNARGLIRARVQLNERPASASSECRTLEAELVPILFLARKW